MLAHGIKLPEGLVKLNLASLSLAFLGRDVMRLSSRCHFYGQTTGKSGDQILEFTPGITVGGYQVYS